MSFPAIGSRKLNSHRSNTILLSIISGSPLVSHYRYGAPKGGSIRMIPAAGFNGIAAISSGGDWVRKTRDRLDDGKQCSATSARFKSTASPMICTAAGGNDKLCCSGRMTVERSEPERPDFNAANMRHSRGAENGRRERRLR